MTQNGGIFVKTESFFGRLEVLALKVNELFQQGQSGLFILAFF